MPKEKKEKPEVPKESQRYALEVTFFEPLLASSPASPEVYRDFIAGHKRVSAEEAGEEIATLPVDKREELGWSVFHEDDDGLLFYNHQPRGFLKEAAGAVTGSTQLSAYRRKIDNWLFVFPRRIYLMRDGVILKKPEGVLERPVRAMTPQGPRITVKRSDLVNPGASYKAELLVMPLGTPFFTEERLREWLDYGALCGQGEWRTGGYGTFEYTLTRLEPKNWREYRPSLIAQPVSA